MPSALAEAVAMARSGDTKGGLRAFTDILLLDPVNATAAVFLAQLLIDTGRQDDALPYLAIAQEHGKDNGVVQSCIGGALFNLGDIERLDEALAAMRRATSLCPDRAAFWRNRGKIASQARSATIGEAMNCLDRAVRLDRSDAESYLLMGHEFRKMKRFPQAKKSFEKALALQPDNEAAAFWLATITSKKVARMPKHLVRDLFNSYAGTFESHLVGGLGYRAPEILRDELLRACVSLGRDAAWSRCADLGCGTGLVGAAVRKHCGHLVGVDLAKDMLPKASAVGYDIVVEADAAEWMQRVPDAAPCTACAASAAHDAGGPTSPPPTLAARDDDSVDANADGRSVADDGYDDDEMASDAGSATSTECMSPARGPAFPPPSPSPREASPLPRSFSFLSLDVADSPRAAADRAAADRGSVDAPLPRAPATTGPAAPSPCACTAGPYDLVLCGDLFVYIGDLDPLFSSVAGATRPGAMVALSTEVDLDSPSTKPAFLGGSGGGGGGGGGGPVDSDSISTSWRVTPTGRFKHATAYVTATAAKHGFRLHSSVRDVLRRHAGAAIMADYMVFVKGL